jgi:flagellar biogenesis protein FliO
MAGVGLVMALLFATAWIAARRKNGLPLLGRFRRARMDGRRLILVERLPLTPHHALYLVHVEGRPYLLATHPQGLSLSAAGGAASDFSSVFAAAVHPEMSQGPDGGRQ